MSHADKNLRPEFILAQEATASHVNFAFIGNAGLKTAFSTSAIIGNAEKEPQMDAKSHEQLIALTSPDIQEPDPREPDAPPPDVKEPDPPAAPVQKPPPDPAAAQDGWA